MAEEKKTVTVKPVAKAVAATSEVKKEVAPVVEKKEEPAKKAEAPKKEAAKKAPTKKAETAKAGKASLTIEFKGNKYTEASLVQSAKDVWVYDLGKNIKDFKTVDLYVKPEESLAYYVINNEITGNFYL